MNFKEYVENDLKTTFINNNEFASYKDINGKSVLVVEDYDKLEERTKTDYEGLVLGDILFYISFEEYKKIPSVLERPAVSMALRYDGLASTVMQVGEVNGMYEIILRTAGGY